MRFDRAFLTVRTGSVVVVAFKNSSTVNQHTWVLVKSGTKDEVAVRGTTAGPDNDWVQAGDPDVVAHSKLLGPGETGEARFAAPAAGKYQFMYTLPGHSFTMFGDFEVTR